MASMRTETVAAPAYVGGSAGLGTRVREWWGELWADKPRLRRVAMIWGVSAVAIVSLFLYLTGGRYVSNDDAYVHAAKLMVSTDVSGLVLEVNVKEGQHVKQGQVLFRLDPRPFVIALDNAKANLAQAVLDTNSLKATYQSALGQIAAQRAQVNLAQITYNRYLSLARQNAIASTQVDTARGTLQTAQATLISLQENAQTDLAKLNGNPNLPAEQSPEYLKAKAAVDEAQRQLDHAVVRAPFNGVVTEVDSLQPGTLVISAMSAFTTTSAVGLVSDNNIWIEADTKETDLTYVRKGDPVTFTVDTYPGRTWHGHVDTVDAASDSAFSMLPAENTSGNWVKVVQRIPVRIHVDAKPGDPPLRAGMSAVISIDTGQRRWNRMLFGNNS
jgi:membrane fusion protein (multidrug efflux system)